jgi:hypothetical protein
MGLLCTRHKSGAPAHVPDCLHSAPSIEGAEVDPAVRDHVVLRPAANLGRLDSRVKDRQQVAASIPPLSATTARANAMRE